MSGESNLPAVLTAAQAAAYLQISVVTLYRWVRKMGLPAVRIGRTLRFPQPVLERWLTDMAHGHPAETDGGGAHPHAGPSGRVPRADALAGRR